MDFFVVDAMRHRGYAILLDLTMAKLSQAKLPYPARGFVSAVFDQILYSRKAAVMARKKSFWITFYVARFDIVSSADGSLISASAMAEAIFNRHIAPSSGKVAARAGRLQPLEIA